MTPRSRDLLGAWAPPAAWALLIFVGSSFPARTGRILFHGADKVLHVVEYGMLGYLSARAFRRTLPAWPRARLLLATALLAVAYGTTDECHQSFVPEREMEWGDLAADAAGGLAGAALFVGMMGRRTALSAPPRSP